MPSKISYWKRIRGLLSTISPSAGLMPTANLGTGTANSTTFLRGDQTYATAIGGTTGSIDNRVLRSDGTDGGKAQASNVTLDDTGNLTVIAGLVAGSGSLAVTTAFDVLVWQGGKLGFANAAVGVGSSADSYFVRNSAGSIGVKASGGGDGAFTTGAITASGNVSVGSFLTLSSGGSFAQIADTGANGLWFSSNGGVGIRNAASFANGSANRMIWTNGANNFYGSTVDTAIGRASAGVVGLYTDVSGATLAGLSCGAITASGDVATPGISSFANNGIKCGGVNVGRGAGAVVAGEQINVYGNSVNKIAIVASQGLNLASDMLFSMSSTTAVSGAKDLSFGRQSTGVFQIGNGTANALGSLACAAITASGLMCAGTYTVATLPIASANAYKFATVSDSSVTAYGSTVAGSGSSKVMVFSNGSNWTVCAA